jgi:hypothetical protein
MTLIPDFGAGFYIKTHRNISLNVLPIANPFSRVNDIPGAGFAVEKLVHVIIGL